MEGDKRQIEIMLSRNATAAHNRCQLRKATEDELECLYNLVHTFLPKYNKTYKNLFNSPDEDNKKKILVLYVLFNRYDNIFIKFFIAGCITELSYDEKFSPSPYPAPFQKGGTETINRLFSSLPLNAQKAVRKYKPVFDLFDRIALSLQQVENITNDLKSLNSEESLLLEGKGNEGIKWLKDFTPSFKVLTDLYHSFFDFISYIVTHLDKCSFDTNNERPNRYYPMREYALKSEGTMTFAERFKNTWIHLVHRDTTMYFCETRQVSNNFSFISDIVDNTTRTNFPFVNRVISMNPRFKFKFTYISIENFANVINDVVFTFAETMSELLYKPIINKSIQRIRPFIQEYANSLITNRKSNIVLLHLKTQIDVKYSYYIAKNDKDTNPYFNYAYSETDAYSETGFADLFSKCDNCAQNQIELRKITDQNQIELREITYPEWQYLLSSEYETSLGEYKTSLGKPFFKDIPIFNEDMEDMAQEIRDCYVPSRDINFDIINFWLDKDPISDENLDRIVELFSLYNSYSKEVMQNQNWTDNTSKKYFYTYHGTTQSIMEDEMVTATFLSTTTNPSIAMYYADYMGFIYILKFDNSIPFVNFNDHKSEVVIPMGTKFRTTQQTVYGTYVIIECECVENVLIKAGKLESFCTNFITHASRPKTITLNDKNVEGQPKKTCINGTPPFNGIKIAEIGLEHKAYFDLGSSPMFKVGDKVYKYPLKHNQVNFHINQNIKRLLNEMLAAFIYKIVFNCDTQSYNAVRVEQTKKPTKKPNAVSPFNDNDYVLYLESSYRDEITNYRNNHDNKKTLYNAQRKEVLIDMVMANWDAYNNNNTIIINDKILRVDVGGCLNYRGKGDLNYSFSYESPVDKDVFILNEKFGEMMMMYTESNTNTDYTQNNAVDVSVNDEYPPDSDFQNQATIQQDTETKFTLKNFVNDNLNRLKQALEEEEFQNILKTDGCANNPYNVAAWIDAKNNTHTNYVNFILQTTETFYRRLEYYKTNGEKICTLIFNKYNANVNKKGGKMRDCKSRQCTVKDIDNFLVPRIEADMPQQYGAFMPEDLFTKLVSEIVGPIK